MKDIHISRRTFLQIVGAMPVIEVARSFENNMGIVPNNTRSDRKEHQTSTEDYPHTEFDIQKIKTDILEYRKQLGFMNMPKDFIEAEKLANTDWKKSDTQVANNLPEELQTYGEYTQVLLERIYGGEHTSHFLHAIEYVDSLSHFASYRRKSKSNYYGLAVFDFNLEEFTDYLLHESAGHAFDPSFHHETMPFETYARMTHGRWRMLAQAMTIENQFFNHPNDAAYPTVLRHTGEEAARYVVLEADTSQICDIPSYPKLLKILLHIREQIPAHDGQIYFNNKVSKLFGTLLINEEVQLEGKTRDVFEREMEDALDEIYAEMIKYVIRYPEQLGNNTEIKAGFAEIASAVRGTPFTPDDIARIDVSVPFDITERWVEGQKLLHNTVTEERNKNILETNKKRERYDLYFGNDIKIMSNLFVTIANEGSIDATQKEHLSKYVEYCSDMYNTFGDLLYDTTYQFLTPQFDPDDLHAWTIRDIVYAIDTQFVERLVSNILDREFQHIDWEELARKKGILDEYRNSSKSQIKLNRG